MGLTIGVVQFITLDSKPSISKSATTGEDELLWEVDEFEGVLGGLIIAEVELEDEHQDVVLPSGLDLITYLKGWSNSALSMMVKVQN